MKTKEEEEEKKGSFINNRLKIPTLE